MFSAMENAPSVMKQNRNGWLGGLREMQWEEEGAQGIGEAHMQDCWLTNILVQDSMPGWVLKTE